MDPTAGTGNTYYKQGGMPKSLRDKVLKKSAVPQHTLAKRGFIEESKDAPTDGGDDAPGATSRLMLADYGLSDVYQYQDQVDQLSEESSEADNEEVDQRDSDYNQYDAIRDGEPVEDGDDDMEFDNPPRGYRGLKRSLRTRADRKTRYGSMYGESSFRAAQEKAEITRTQRYPEIFFRF